VRPATDPIERLRDLHEGERHLAAVVAMGDAAIPSLERLLRGPSESVPQPRCLAADALALIGTRSAVDALVRALSDSTSRRLEPVLEHVEYVVINGIAENLGNAGDVRAVPALVEASGKRAYPEVARALGRLKDPRAIPVLVERLHADVTREAAMDALRGFDASLVRPHLVAAVTSSADRGEAERRDRAWGRAAACTLLGEIGGAGEVLRGALADRGGDVRLAAALALARSTDTGEEAVHVLVDALGTEDWQRAEDIEQALVRLDGSGLPVLVRTLRETPRVPRAARLRSRIVEVLARIPALEATSALAAMARDPDATCRCTTVVALAQQPYPEALDAMSGFARDSSALVRERLAVALASRGPDATDLLARLSTDRDRRVRRAAIASLVRLGEPALRRLRSARSWRALWVSWRVARRLDHST